VLNLPNLLALPEPAPLVPRVCSEVRTWKLQSAEGVDLQRSHQRDYGRKRTARSSPSHGSDPAPGKAVPPAAAQLPVSWRPTARHSSTSCPEAQR